VQVTLRDYTSLRPGLSPEWAELNLDEAAAWLRRLAASAPLRATLGRRAQEAFRRYQRAAARLEFVDDIFALRDHLQAQGDGARWRAERLERFLAVRSVVQRESMGIPRWLLQLGREQFDRHLGWRLRGGRA
jgi:hypothetical protein